MFAARHMQSIDTPPKSPFVKGGLGVAKRLNGRASPVRHIVLRYC